ncbi:MAG: methionine adenosyltransferase domain-containing protein [Proteobacteria bacterium]|nr:methionine adenosyltransferase domain-containing protein [Pseudomonadota bacterium]
MPRSPRAVRVAVEREMTLLADEISGLSTEVPESISVNGAGSFDVGGPEGDNGLSGKKLVVDAYGPRVPIGGGALSGKDFFKADRAGALHARRVAKAVVITGAAREATVKLARFPGDRQAQLLSIETDRSELLDVRLWQVLFDLSLEASGDAWTCGADLCRVARYGHFTDSDHAWENLRFSSAKAA